MLVFLVISRSSDYMGYDRWASKAVLKDLTNIDVKRGKFFSSLNQSDKDWLQTENEFLEKKYGVKKVPDEKVQQMTEAKETKRKIIRVPFYDMLANITYRNQFEYDSVINDNQIQRAKTIKATASLGSDRGISSIIDEYIVSEEKIDFRFQGGMTLLCLNLPYMTRN